MIQSVTGILPPEALTFCQCHEHILLSKGVSWQRNHALCMEDIQKSMQELLDYRAAGGSTIVDAQPVGCNRMTKELVQAYRSSLRPAFTRTVSTLPSIGFTHILSSSLPKSISMS